MKSHIKLNDVFNKYAGILNIRARMGNEWSVLVSDADKQGLPESFNSYAAADSKVTTLNRQGIDAAVVWTDPFAKDLKTGYRLYIKPVHGFGSFDNG